MLQMIHYHRYRDLLQTKDSFIRRKYYLKQPDGYHLRWCNIPAGELLHIKWGKSHEWKNLQRKMSKFSTNTVINNFYYNFALWYTKHDVPAFTSVYQTMYCSIHWHTTALFGGVLLLKLNLQFFTKHHIETTLDYNKHTQKKPCVIGQFTHYLMWQAMLRFFYFNGWKIRTKSQSPHTQMETINIF